jgi:hypothetical protein
MNEMGSLNLPLDECNLARFEACPASLDLRSCLRASCPALRDSGWNNFSLLVAFCGFFVGAMSTGIFHLRHLRASARKIKDSIIISGRLAPTTVLDVIPGLRRRFHCHVRYASESPNVAFRGELEGKWGWTDEPLYMIAFIGSLPARRIRLKPSQWLQITPTIPPSQ